MPFEFTDLCAILFQLVAFMRSQHSKVIHQIFFFKKKMIHGPKRLKTTVLNLSASFFNSLKKPNQLKKIKNFNPTATSWHLKAGRDNCLTVALSSTLICKFRGQIYSEDKYMKMMMLLMMIITELQAKADFIYWPCSQATDPRM